VEDGRGAEVETPPPLVSNDRVTRRPPPPAEATLDPGAALAPGAAVGGRFLAIYEIGRRLLEQREPAEVLAAIHQAIVEKVEPDHACVLAVAPDGSYRAVAAHGLALAGPASAWPLSHTVLQRARESALAVLAADARRDGALEEAGSIHRLRIHSVMCVPLGRGAVRGLIYLDNRAEERAFTRDDLEFVTAVARYATLVLERAEDFARTTQTLRLQEQRLELLQQELLRHEIVGRAPALLAAYDAVRRFAGGGARVLLRGETGTGKELFARAFAASSERAGGPYVPVPIPALAPSLLESELFGHARGAFTEASRDRKGRLELADGGVLFLDEVGDIEPALQPKLLRFLDSGELHRVGENEPRRVDALLVSATNRPLEKDLAEGRLRADLLARLGHAITIPPLRERREDVPLLAGHFLRRYDRSGRKSFSAPALARLAAHSWPFNVRELQQVVERVTCLVDHDTILPEDLPAAFQEARAPAPRPAAPGAPPRPLGEVMAELERHHILEALEFAKGNKRRAIEILGISADTFYRRLREFSLRSED
jgi:transcriptional regulator with GAF, ATPase, and Fis domain